MGSWIRYKTIKRSRNRMEPCGTPTFKMRVEEEKSGNKWSREWKSGRQEFQKEGGDQHLQMLEKSRRKKKSVGFGD